MFISIPCLWSCLFDGLVGKTRNDLIIRQLIQPVFKTPYEF